MFDEIQGKQTDVDHLLKESEVLSEWSKDSAPSKQVVNLEKQWKALSEECTEKRDQLELEAHDCSDYYQTLQEVEKWLLQMSFQLMAHNSLYITNKEQTLEQIKQHDILLQDIVEYVNFL